MLYVNIHSIQREDAFHKDMWNNKYTVFYFDHET